MRDELIRIVREGLLQAGIDETQPLVAAASGGCDSMVLLSVLHAMGHPMVVAHVNYGKRGEESDGDEQFVRDWCGERSLAFVSQKLNIDPTDGQGFQGEARKARYAWFQQVCTAHGCVAVATGHHANDQAEGLLLHAIRGLDPLALAGMRLWDGEVVRPLLTVTRQQIEACAKAEGWAWRDDQSNQSLVHLRNSIRHRLLPLLDDIQPGTSEHLVQLASRMMELKQAVEPALQVAEGEARVAEYVWDVNALQRNGMARLAFRQALKQDGWSSKAIDSALGLLDSQVGSQVACGALRVVRERTTLVRVHSDDLGSLPPLDIESARDSGAHGPIDWRPSPRPEDLTSLSLKSCWIPESWLPLTLRTWKPGDNIQPLGMQGHSLVSDVLTQGKLPHQDRQGYPVLSRGIGGDILWIPGLKRSELARIQNNECRDEMGLTFQFRRP
jgi:tRNA(Ile)-lysidine synthase